jgi:hypothetical protein
MTITYEVSYCEQNLWYVSYREEGVSLHQYLGKYKTKIKMQNCVGEGKERDPDRQWSR